jgi:hypothetical protein
MQASNNKNNNKITNLVLKGAYKQFERAKEIERERELTWFTPSHLKLFFPYSVINMMSSFYKKNRSTT